jgi:hypothetical protein
MVRTEIEGTSLIIMPFMDENPSLKSDYCSYSREIPPFLYPEYTLLPLTDSHTSPF